MTYKPIVCPDCHQTRPPLNLIHQCHGCTGCAAHAQDETTTPTKPDPRRPCERVTDGRCMFNPDTCTPTCHLDWNTENQPVTTPRIGDTVHYRIAEHCYAAIVTDTTEDSAHLTVFPRTGGPLGMANTPHDTNAAWVDNAAGERVIEQFTPGTWHHIH